MSEHTYAEAVKSVSIAVNTNEKSGESWKKSGSIVADHFKTAERLEAIKAQFIMDAIMPGLDKRHAAALAVDLPRKGSKEYNELSDVNKLKWDAANQAKKDARAIAHTYFARVLSYAFPKEKTDAAASNPPKTLKTKLIEAVTDCIGKIEKAETPDFDAPAALKELRAALAILAK